MVWAEMARSGAPLGRVQPRPGADDRWRIDFGRRWGPRYLYSFRGVVFDSETLATSILGYVEMESAKGRQLPDILSELAPEAGDTADVKVFVDRWLALFRRMVEAGDCQPRTLRDLERWTGDGPKAWWDWWWGRSIWDIDTAALREWSYFMADGGLSGKSRWNVMAGFSSFLTWLSEDRKAFERPKIPWPEKEETLPEVYSLNDRDRVLEAIPWDERGAFLVLAWAGARPSEVRVLRLRQWEGDWIRFREAAKDRHVEGVRRGTKKNREKVIPVENAELRRWLEEFVPASRRLADPDGPLFKNPRALNRGGWWGEDALGAAWKAATVVAGLPYISLYCGTKHSLGTALSEAGVHDRVIAQVFGHADPRSVVPYSKIRPTAVRGALAKLKTEETE